MKKLIYSVAAILLLLGLVACSENDNPSDNPILGYSLDQFVNADTVRALVDAGAPDTLDFRGLYSYEIVSADDGFSPRSSSYAGYDLSWALFKAGYLVPSDNNRTWFPNSDLPGAFKVRNAGEFRLYRRVQVNSGAVSKDVELRGLTLHTVANWNSADEAAIKLSDLLCGIAVYDSVRFTAADGYTKTYLPELVDAGYYLLDSEVTTFGDLNPNLPGGTKKFKKLSGFTIYGAATAPAAGFILAQPTAADISFPVPASFNGYESTEMLDE